MIEEKARDNELLFAHPEIVKSSFFSFYERHGFEKAGGNSLLGNTGFWKICLANSALIKFTPVFKGEERLRRPICLSQKCVKGVFDWVGRREGFLTFFEQLGTGSQTHSKKEAISLFWKFFEDSLRMSKDPFLVTVFDGDKESYGIWRRLGFADNQILRFRERNFFNLADGRVRGPVSALIYDRGDEHHRRFRLGERSATKDCHLDCACGRYSELGDIGFFTSPDGVFLVDTGIGFERLMAVLSGKESIFEVGSLKLLVDLIKTRTGQAVKVDGEKDVAIKVIADHARSAAILVADGVFPSNKEAGYVTRKIIRRAVLAGRKLGLKEPFLYSLMPEVITIIEMSGSLPRDMGEQISNRVKVEEERFFRTIDRGMKIFSKICKDECPVIPERVAFFLYDTHGLPFELIQGLAEEKGWSVDVEDFKAMFR